jgi:hypothetical protein
LKTRYVSEFIEKYFCSLGSEFCFRKKYFQEVGKRGNIKGTTMTPGFDLSPRVRIVCKRIKKGGDVNIIS